MKYNGWHNWETWVVSLWYGDSLDGMDADSIKELVEETVDSYLAKGWEGTILNDMTSGFLGEVNWEELEEHYREEKGEESV